MKTIIDATKLVIGGKYNWVNQPERLVYLGIFIGGGRWHQFAKVESPTVVWCEVAGTELHLIEETKREEAQTAAPMSYRQGRLTSNPKIGWEAVSEEVYDNLSDWNRRIYTPPVESLVHPCPPQAERVPNFIKDMTLDSDNTLRSDIPSMTQLRNIISSVQDGEITVSRALECLAALEVGHFEDDWLPAKVGYFGDELPIDFTRNLRVNFEKRLYALWQRLQSGAKPKSWSEFTLLATLNGEKPPKEISETLHYPQCWDTAAYPTLESAIAEVTSDFRCSTCKP